MDINDEVRHGIESFSSGRLAAAGQDHSISHVKRRVAEIQRALDRFLAIMREHGNPGATALDQVTDRRPSKWLAWFQPPYVRKVEHLGKAWVIGVVHLGPDLLPTRMYVTTDGKLYQESYKLMECTLGCERSISDSTQTKLEETIPYYICQRLAEQGLRSQWTDI